MFDVGVLGLMFWAVYMGSEAGGVSVFWEVGLGGLPRPCLAFLLWLSMSMTSQPFPLLLVCIWSCLCHFCSICSAGGAHDMAGGCWFSKPWGRLWVLGGGQHLRWAEWAEGNIPASSLVYLSWSSALGTSLTLSILSLWLLDPIYAAFMVFVMLVGLADMCDVAGVH